MPMRGTVQGRLDREGNAESTAHTAKGGNDSRRKKLVQGAAHDREEAVICQRIANQAP